MLWVKRLALVALGIVALAVSAKIRCRCGPRRCRSRLGTFAVLTIGAAYGPRLGLATILGYLLIGALGFDVFAGSSAEKNGIAYMLGGTGGYLSATCWRCWRSATRRGAAGTAACRHGAAMLIGNVLIYVPGLAWLHHLIAGGLFDPATYATAWEQTLAWGLTPYLIGDALKLALAALVVPGLWKLVGSARA